MPAQVRTGRPPRAHRSSDATGARAVGFSMAAPSCMLVACARTERLRTTLGATATPATAPSRGLINPNPGAAPENLRVTTCRPRTPSKRPAVRASLYSAWTDRNAVNGLNRAEQVANRLLLVVSIELGLAGSMLPYLGHRAHNSAGGESYYGTRWAKVWVACADQLVKRQPRQAPAQLAPTGGSRIAPRLSIHKPRLCVCARAQPAPASARPAAAAMPPTPQQPRRHSSAATAPGTASTDSCPHGRRGSTCAGAGALRL